MFSKTRFLAVKNIHFHLTRKCLFSSEAASAAFRPFQSSFSRFSNSQEPPQKASPSVSALSKQNAFEEEDSNSDFSLAPQFISTEPFPDSISQILQSEINPEEIEIRSDGFIYLPEIRYRQLLMKAFGVGGWTLIPKGGHSLSQDWVSREYWLFCRGKFISAARGFGLIRNGELSDAAEAAKSNALMRCCKDLGIAKDLWNPEYVKKWKEAFATTYSSPDGKRTMWRKK